MTCYRYRLTAPHYLHILDQEGTPNEWEYEEVDMATSRKRRKRFRVPMYLHPQDGSCWTHCVLDPRGRAVDGQIIVASEKSSDPRDFIFEGPPTMDMEPMDEPSRIHQRQCNPQKIEGFGFDPFDALPKSIGEMMRDEMEKQITSMGGRQPMAAISVNEFESLKVQNAVMAKQLEELSKMVAAVTQPPATPEVAKGGFDRRV